MRALQTSLCLEVYPVSPNNTIQLVYTIRESFFKDERPLHIQDALFDWSASEDIEGTCDGYLNHAQSFQYYHHLHYILDATKVPL